MKQITLILFTVAAILSFTSPSKAADSTLAEGSLNGAFSSWGSSSLEGDWKIIEADGKQFIELSDNFKAKDGPDVKIFLSPLDATSITGKNAAQNSLFVMQISSFKGQSRIEIPQGTNLNDYKTLVFHCEAYSKLWGSSTLVKS